MQMNISKECQIDKKIIDLSGGQILPLVGENTLLFLSYQQLPRLVSDS